MLHVNRFHEAEHLKYIRFSVREISTPAHPIKEISTLHSDKMFYLCIHSFKIQISIMIYHLQIKEMFMCNLLIKEPYSITFHTQSTCRDLFLLAVLSFKNRIFHLTYPISFPRAFFNVEYTVKIQKVFFFSPQSLKYLNNY